MVRAILAGAKTQTRRVVKHSPGMHADRVAWDMGRCPYGRPGDRLWVRENGWERPERTPKMMRNGADTWAPYYFDADGLYWQEVEDFKLWGFKRRPSIHMPRWASRITLEVTAVRVQWLQDISEADSLAEGIMRTHDGFGLPDGKHFHAADPRRSYLGLWEAINGPGSVEANPLVWVLSFRQIEAATSAADSR